LSGPSTISRAIARAVYFFIDDSLRRIYRAIHPHTASEADLHEHLKRAGLEPWKQAIRARHQVRIGSSTPIMTELRVPQGQVVLAQAASPVPFRLTQSIQIPTSTQEDARGYYTVEAQVECLHEGAIGNVAPDSIVEFDSPPDGVDVIYNPETEPLIEGRERESIAAVRARLRISESEGAAAMWTPAWYVQEVLAFTYVERAVFVSSKKLGREGEVQLLLLGTNGLLSQVQLREIEDYFATDERDPGGVAHVIATNIATQEIEKSFVILFSAAENVPTRQQVDEAVEGYFYSLSAGDDFEDAGIISLFNTMPGYVTTTLTPPGNISIPDATLAIPAPTFSVEAQVYAG
jgi:hypothetical protein